jgi:hypothetical protein
LITAGFANYVLWKKSDGDRLGDAVAVARTAANLMLPLTTSFKIAALLSIKACR